jgi:predicted DNA-binding transcriptional regulator AlpA
MHPNSNVLLLTAIEAAKALAISPRTLWGLTKSGQIPCVRINSWTVRYALEDLKGWVEKQKGKPTPPSRSRKKSDSKPGRCLNTS